MSNISDRERQTQERVKAFFVNELGYRSLGNWQYREDCSNVETDILKSWLAGRGHSEAVITKTLDTLTRSKTVGGSVSLYGANQKVYDNLRYGVKVKADVGEQTQTVWLIDWQDVTANDFAIAEEVTVTGKNTKRPDVVLYVNGIALGVLELKRSTVDISEGIRQNLDNQQKDYIQAFFSTMQLVMAGNETQGLRYGTTETTERYYLRWKEAGADGTGVSAGLYEDLAHLCRPERLLEIIHDFTVFDAGTKKTCRHNQYFGVKAAQARIKTREGGIVWHTQGSGKSLTMVWLAKWLREHQDDARVLLITDRSELDEQIEKVFAGVQENIYRTSSGNDLVNVLNNGTEWLICSLIHKFGKQSKQELNERDVDAYLSDIQKHLPPDFRAKGNIFVFVDECHRTQSGKLHQAMKMLLPTAMFIGFTGTPLLTEDKHTSLEVFGSYIHTYKYDEAVKDEVVLDLRYEARNIDQRLASPDKVNQWFDAKTQNLSDLGKARLKQRWGSMQKLLSAKERLEQIKDDIIFDMGTRDRLMSGRGNAMLVADSIYSACRFYELFEKTELKGKCAIITSYTPSTSDPKGETTGEGQTEQLRQYEIYRRMLADFFEEPEDTAMYKVDAFESMVKERFIKQPGQMKLLIVVDKLLTGFDAPSATYLYIDKKMRDHGLFQAICRVNRLDGQDKTYGHVIDYKDLFRSLEQSISDYTSEALDGYDKEDVQGLLKDRLEQGRQALEDAREQVKALCEPVPPPKDTAAYLHYFVGTTGDPKDAAAAVKDNEPKRVALYKYVSSFVRAYADLATDMAEAGYSRDEVDTIREEIKDYEAIREAVKVASGDYVDMTMYDPGMRELLDMYVRANESNTLSAFDDMTLVELIVQRGQDAVKTLPESIRGSKEAVAETIENNVRKAIVDEHGVNPKYYDAMSHLLDELIAARKQETLEYEKYLEKIVELTRKVKQQDQQQGYPPTINTAARKAFYDNLDQDEALAVLLDETIRNVKKADWRGNRFKEREILIAIARVLGDDERARALLELAKNQTEY